MDQVKVYGLVSNSLTNVKMCSSFSIAEEYKQLLEAKVTDTITLKPVETNVLIFDDGRLDASMADKYSVVLNDISFVFLIPDYSSLMFELVRSLSTENELVVLESKMSSVVITKTEAETLWDFLSANNKKFKKLEDEWFATQVSKLPASEEDSNIQKWLH